MKGHPQELGIYDIVVMVTGVVRHDVRLRGRFAEFLARSGRRLHVKPL